MKGKKFVVGLLAAFVVGVIISAAYFYSGPDYERLSKESQELRWEIEIRRVSESKMEEEMSRLKTTLQENKAELAEKTRLVEDLKTKLKEFTEGVSQRPSHQEIRTVPITESAPGTVDHMVIRRAAIALRVEDRKAIGVSQQVSVRQQRVYCWMHVINGKGEKIVVRWISKGQEIAETRLPVGSDSWRTWAYVPLRPGMIGPARVEILDENDKHLKTLSFEITE